MDEFATRLFRYLRLKVSTDQDAEDLVQETFLRAWRAIRQFQPGRSFAAWLFTIATRLAISHHRARRPAADVDAIDLADRRVEDPSHLAQQRESHQALWPVARQVLGDDQFAALWMFYVEEFPVHEISRVLGKTQVHVKVMLHRARKKLGETRLLADAHAADRPTPRRSEPCSAI